MNKSRKEKKRKQPETLPPRDGLTELADEDLKQIQGGTLPRPPIIKGSDGLTSGYIGETEKAVQQA
jgi:hypothetical protein